MSHTKGPWIYDAEESIVSGADAMIAHVYTLEDFPCFDAGLEPGDGGQQGRAEADAECKANAQLIVAAPKMEDFIQRFTAHLELCNSITREEQPFMDEAEALLVEIKGAE